MAGLDYCSLIARLLDEKSTFGEDETRRILQYTARRSSGNAEQALLRLNLLL
jgi:hypothetical protein